MSRSFKRYSRKGRGRGAAQPIKFGRVLDADPYDVIQSPVMRRAFLGVLWLAAFGVCLLFVGTVLEGAETSGRLGRLIGRFEVMGWLCFVFAALWYCAAYLREASK